MRISIVVAVDKNNGIGYQNRLPWRLPADLRQVKLLTMGHHLIMGRKTYESIGKPLPGRVTIIVTRNPNYQAEGCLISRSLTDALALAGENEESEVFIFGGSDIYQEALLVTDRIYITHIHAEFQVDTYFPDFDRSLWIETNSVFHPADEENPYPFTFQILERRT
ncbi:dihydrofolate reductase [Chloroflexota bacterium]